MDSIKFYKNGSFYESAGPIEDSDKHFFLPIHIIIGKWNISNTGKILRSDSATNCIRIKTIFTKGNATILAAFTLVDWHRIKGTKFRKISGNLDQPFLVYSYYDGGIEWKRREIWQPRREFKKAKPKTR